MYIYSGSSQADCAAPALPAPRYPVVYHEGVQVLRSHRETWGKHDLCTNSQPSFFKVEYWHFWANLFINSNIHSIRFRIFLSKIVIYDLWLFQCFLVFFNSLYQVLLGYVSYISQEVQERRPFLQFFLINQISIIGPS